MHFSILSTVFCATAALAAPGFKARQASSPSTVNNSASQTIQVTNINWQRSGSTVNGISFQASVEGASPAESHSCTSITGTGESFQATQINLCTAGGPITFTYNAGSSSNVQVWYTNGLKSYVGQFAVTPGNTNPVTLQLSEIEQSPTSTPQVSN